MKQVDKNHLAFLSLVKAGLWEEDVQLESFGEIDYNEIYRLAEEQSVLGLVTAGLDHIKDVTPPKEDLLQFVGIALQLEQQNSAMNDFIGVLVEKMRAVGIYTLLVKGQGVAQCYERPLWRACGDVDLFMSDNNYQSAVNLLTPLASSVDEENKYNQHLSMTIDSRSVELHGTLRSGLWRRLDKELDNVQRAVFYDGKVRSWMNGRTQVFLPGPDEDVTFIFSHILQHFFKEGIGLRQICDWCRLLWKYKDSIDVGLLEKRLISMGIMTEWKAFAVLAVNYLGMPEDVIPLRSDNGKWSRKATKIMNFIIETGNFGHNRDYSYRQKNSFVVYKAISLWRHIKDFGRYFVIFPLDSIKVTWMKICVGVTVAFKDNESKNNK